MRLLLLFVVHSIIFQFMYGMNCCDDTSKLEKAIMVSDFNTVRQIFDNLELPLMTRQLECKKLAKDMTEQRLKKVSKTSKSRVNYGLLTCTAALLNGLNISRNLKESDPTLAGVTCIASLLIAGRGVYITLDGICRWTEKDELARAMAIEHLLAERMPSNRDTIFCLNVS